jgi:hypothetical protein
LPGAVRDADGDERGHTCARPEWTPLAPAHVSPPAG